MSVQSVIVTVLVVALVGAAVYGGLRLFSSKSVDASRDALTQELLDIGDEAVFFHNRPRVMGGGDKDFKNFKPQQRGKDKAKNENKGQGQGQGQGKGKGKDKGDDNSDSTTLIELAESENGIFYLVSATSDSIVIDAVGNFVGSDNTNPVRIRLIQTPSSRALQNLN